MAKEKGFDEECLRTYAYWDELEPDKIELVEIDEECQLQPSTQWFAVCAAPLYQQLIDWFRNKHGIVIWIETAPYARTFNFRFYIETSDNRLEGNKSKDYYKVYNEAFEYAFKLIK
jgi:hypothetical protein